MKIAENWAAYVEVKIESEIWTSHTKVLLRYARNLISHPHFDDLFRSFSELEFYATESIMKTQAFEGFDSDKKIVYLDLAKKMLKEVWDEKISDH